MNPQIEITVPYGLFAQLPTPRRDWKRFADRVAELLAEDGWDCDILLNRLFTEDYNVMATVYLRDNWLGAGHRLANSLLSDPALRPYTAQLITNMADWLEQHGRHDARKAVQVAATEFGANLNVRRSEKNESV